LLLLELTSLGLLPPGSLSKCEIQACKILIILPPLLVFAGPVQGIFINASSHIDQSSPNKPVTARITKHTPIRTNFTIPTTKIQINSIANIKIPVQIQPIIKFIQKLDNVKFLSLERAFTIAIRAAETPFNKINTNTKFSPDKQRKTLIGSISNTITLRDISISCQLFNVY